MKHRPNTEITADARRFARYVIEHGWMHLILLAGVGIFIFPFVWLVMTSFKTDEEVTSPSLMPSIPTFTARSPYVMPPPQLIMPLEVPAGRWDAVSPKLLEMSRTAALARLKTLGSDPVDPAQHADSAAAVIVNNLAARLPTATWSASDATVFAAFSPLLTDQAVDQALDDRLSRLELRGLIVRSLDAHMFTVADPAQIAKQWKVISGNGQIIAGRDGTPYLKYQFDSASSAPVVIKYDFDFPFDPSQLHKLTISMFTDDSWHKLLPDLQVASDHWIAREPGFLAQHRAGSFIFQPPTYEDESNKPHIWITLDHTAAAPSPGIDPRHATPLTLTPHSHLHPRRHRRQDRAQLHPRRALCSLLEIRRQQRHPRHANHHRHTLLQHLRRLCFRASPLAGPIDRVRGILLSTMMLPSQVTMIPSFMIWRSLGWFNTLNPLWVPAWFGSAFFIFLMVQNMKTIPRELEEAARLDGLNAVQTWWYIIVPLVKPAAAADRHS